MNHPKYPITGRGSKSVEVTKTEWNSTPVEHRAIKRIRTEGGWYKEVYVISPEAAKDKKTEEKPVDKKKNKD